MRKSMRRTIIRTITLVIILVIVLSGVFIYTSMSKEKPNKNNLQIVASNTTTTKPKETAIPEPTEEPVVYRYKEKTTYVQGKLLSKHTINNPKSYGNRNVNMKVAAKIINGKGKKGYILKPKETFSWLKVVGNTTPEKGFKPATVIVNKKYVQDYGGGVCQVSSTINSAVIESGLRTQSQKHSLPSSYIGPKDHEATVTYSGNKDLTFKNTFKFPIKIKVSTKEGAVTVKVFKMKKKITVTKIRE